ncbi:hypothetical protein CJF31_00011378 [Rutstroemia sp. NJR-2017a BVV2]|nr:hypothetical protein CJF31_00011378 [Rutstroemia sp. NJR-2017a BVV2]
MQWTCRMCYSGLYWYIYECKYCKFKICQDCKPKFDPSDVSDTNLLLVFLD